MPDDDVDPWTETTPMVGTDAGDDPFDGWPTDSTIGEVTGPHSYQRQVTRAATGARGRRQRLAWWFAVVWVSTSLVAIIVTLALRA
jgi:hypothetical protein